MTFSATATDGTLVTCAPLSGSPFPLGPTTVLCDATDTAGNKSTGNFTITITDTTAPVITLNGPSSVNLTV